MSDPKIILFPEQDFPLKRIADAFSTARQDADGMTESEKIEHAARTLIKAYHRHALDQAKRLQSDSLFPEFAEAVTLRVQEILEADD